MAFALQRFTQTGEITRRKGSGRPKSARTEENIEDVEGLILSQEDQPGTHQTPRQIARQLNICHQSVRNITDKDLELNVFKKMVVHKISAPNRAKRKIRAADLRRKYRRYF